MKNNIRNMAAALGAFSALVAVDAGVSTAAAQDCFTGEIRQFAGNFAPQGWAFANGQFLAVSDFEALFSIIGATYGGDGRTTFALPDLRGRVPIGAGQGPGLTDRKLGSVTGAESTTLTASDTGPHTHNAVTTSTLHASSAGGDSNVPTGRVLANGGNSAIYHAGPADVALTGAAAISTTTIQPAGESIGFNNLQPSNTTNYVICLFGIYPSRN